jgi:hypothetical protein
MDLHQPLTRDELAELFGVSPRAVDQLRAEGMPALWGGEIAPTREPGRRTRPDWRATRRQVAEFLSIHPDTLTKKLREGLGAAIVDGGGRGREMVFDLRLVVRWHLAEQEVLHRLVLADFRANAAVGALALSQLSLATVLTDVGDRPRSSRRQSPARPEAAAP